jgi:hypothetical protein
MRIFGVGIMEDKRKNAYKTLIYQAFLDIKNSNDLKKAFHIAHSFHNLSEFLIKDFDGMDEDNFWSRIKYLEDNYSLNHYRSLFEETIIGGSS